MTKKNEKKNKKKNKKKYYTPKPGDTFRAAATKEAIKTCVHCRKEIPLGEPARRYVDVNSEGTTNVITGSMHERCWQELYGGGTH
jgi:hypothetical protein